MIRKAVRDLHPVYFGMVMATGIISVAFRGLGFESIARALFFVNLVAYAVLLPMLLGRVAFFGRRVLADLRDPRRRFAFLTFVAGTNVLGNQFLLFGFPEVAQILWYLGLASWCLLLYPIYFMAMTSPAAPVEEVIDGAALLTTVSTQSVAVLGSVLAGRFGPAAPQVLFVTWAFWAVGFVQYLVIISLVAFRLLVGTVKPRDWTGPYWISMGALAITTLAGSQLAAAMDGRPEFALLASVTTVMALITWATGSWWIPLLLSLDVWKFLRGDFPRRVPLWGLIFPWAHLGFGQGAGHAYVPASWGRVFPMGMYAACTLALAKATPFKFLRFVAQYWIWLALAVWALTMVGTLRSVRKGMQPQSPLPVTARGREESTA